MSYSIIGAGAVGQALARAFARKGIQVIIASRRSPEELAPIADTIGPEVTAKSLKDAVEAETILLAVPFRTYNDVAKVAASWKGKLVIDATNAYGVSPEELGNRPSSAVIAEALQGADLVKAFNHLPASVLAEDPQIGDLRRVVFLSGDDEAAVAKAANVVTQLGFAPVALGSIAEGGLLVQARGKSWARLIFQDLFKKGE